MSEAESTTPVEVRAPAGARWLEIDWADGVTTRTHHAVLRGFCPCATCQGHHGAIRWVTGAEDADLELAVLEQVGNYALRLGWGDGHGTGIYAFPHLRALGELGEITAEDVQERRFER
ncbi:MAG: gamma-butyrobetaine hydroxylase-like domain-containing protein [Sandaracinaceae bacterium]